MWEFSKKGRILGAPLEKEALGAPLFRGAPRKRGAPGRLSGRLFRKTMLQKATNNIRDIYSGKRVPCNCQFFEYTEKIRTLVNKCSPSVDHMLKFGFSVKNKCILTT